MVIASGFSRAIAGTGPAFAVFLIPHILAGLTALASGAFVIVSRKGTRLHVRTGTVYFWALAGLAVTAAGLTAVRGPRDLPVFALGVLAVTLATMGRRARRRPAARPWRAWPGHGPHIVAMMGSYTVMLTAFLLDNSKNLPLVDRVPTALSVLVALVFAAVLIGWSVRHHREPHRPPGDTSGAREPIPNASVRTGGGL